MKAPEGAVVSIYYDGEVEVGDALMTRTSRTYLVIAARRQERGKNVGRMHLRCVVADAKAAAGSRRVRPLFWHPRG